MLGAADVENFVSSWERGVIRDKQMRLLTSEFFSALDSELQECGDDIISARGRLIFGSWHLA